MTSIRESPHWVVMFSYVIIFISAQVVLNSLSLKITAKKRERTIRCKSIFLLRKSTSILNVSYIASEFLIFACKSLTLVFKTFLFSLSRTESPPNITLSDSDYCPVCCCFAYRLFDLFSSYYVDSSCWMLVFDCWNETIQLPRQEKRLKMLELFRSVDEQSVFPLCAMMTTEN